MFDITAIGELLIDFTPVRNPGENIIFEQNPGGAPANLLAAAVKLGGKGAFIGKVGDDQFGRFLKDTLTKNGISAEGLKFSKEVNTTLAFVHLDEKGDRSFSFYRKPGADIMLDKSDIQYGLIDNSSIFHFGSLSMTDEPSRTATLTAVEYAAGKGKIISYDPNWRPPLWQSEAIAKDMMRQGFKHADIVKISEVELELLTGETHPGKGSKLLMDTGVKITFVTMGAQGCYYRNARGSGLVKTYNTDIIDTTGAGDAFFGAALYRIAKLNTTALEDISDEELKNIADFANATGALCAQKRGGIPAMPGLSEVNDCIARVEKLP